MERNQFLSNPDNKYAKKYDAFWEWFKSKNESFYKTIYSGNKVEEILIVQISQKLEELGLNIFFLVGLNNDLQAELIFSPEGIIELVYLVEELVEVAPEIHNWTFKSLKPPNQNIDFNVRINTRTFNKDNIKFYPITHPQYPDEIELMIVYKHHYHQEDYEEVYNGVYIFLDNYLGEEIMMEVVDKIHVRGPSKDIAELIPIRKLKDYLIWREKEFVEKYQQIQYNPRTEDYTELEGILEENLPVLFKINTNILNWEYKSSLPWILVIYQEFIAENNDQLPDEKDTLILEQIENEIERMIPQQDGYIFIGRLTTNGIRESFYACKEYRKPARVMRAIHEQFDQKLKIDFEMFKDKYWRYFERFNQVL